MSPFGPHTQVFAKVEVILGTTKDEGILWVIEPIKNNSLFEKRGFF